MQRQLQMAPAATIIVQVDGDCCPFALESHGNVHVLDVVAAHKIAGRETAQRPGTAVPRSVRGVAFCTCCIEWRACSSHLDCLFSGGLEGWTFAAQHTGAKYRSGAESADTEAETAKMNPLVWLLVPLLVAAAPAPAPNTQPWFAGKRAEQDPSGNQQAQGGILVQFDDTVTAQTIMSDVYSISTGCYNLSQNLAGYDGKPVIDTPLLGDFFAIQAAYRKGLWDANSRWNNFTAGECNNIVQYISQTIGKEIPAAVNQLNSNKAWFYLAGQQGVVVSTMKVLMYDQDSFINALTLKLGACNVGAASVASKIHDSIQFGIDQFNS
jgi:hypothetical protein